MIYSKFQDKELSLLGFGTMRFPLLPDGSVDEAQVQAQAPAGALRTLPQAVRAQALPWTALR